MSIHIVPLSRYWHFRFRYCGQDFRGSTKTTDRRAYVAGQHLGMFSTPEEAACAYDAAATARASSQAKQARRGAAWRGKSLICFTCDVVADFLA